jgi:hypothetical protein
MAARLDEIAEGLVTVLGNSATPEPLKIDLWGQSPVNAAFLVRAVATACERTDAPLALVRLGAEMGERLVRGVDREPLALAGVHIELVEDLGASMELYRRPPL